MQAFRQVLMPLFLLILALVFTSSLGAEVRELVIVHTNDFHGHIKEENGYAGAARIAAFVKIQRAHYPGVLFMDAGDAVSGTPVSTMFKGTPIFRVMNAMNYDVGILGNHEFDHGYKQIAQFRTIANQPLLNANVRDRDGKLLGDAPHRIFKVNGISVGIIGVLTEKTPLMITPVGNEGLQFEQPEVALRAQISELQRKVDLIIVLSHVGHEEEKALAQVVTGIDLIVGGHSHTLVNPAIKQGETYIVQAHRYGSHVGFVKLMVDTERDSIVSFSGTLIPAADLPEPDAPVLAAVNTWEEKVAALVDVQIATSERVIKGPQLQALLEEILVSATGADFGYCNIGGIRDKIPAGPVTARHIWNIAPFGNGLVTLTLTGADYLVLLSRENESHPTTELLDPAKTYTVATNSFIGAHAIKTFGDKVVLKDFGVLVRDVVIDAVRDQAL